MKVAFPGTLDPTPFQLGKGDVKTKKRKKKVFYMTKSKRHTSKPKVKADRAAIRQMAALLAETMEVTI